MTVHSVLRALAIGCLLLLAGSCSRRSARDTSSSVAAAAPLPSFELGAVGREPAAAAVVDSRSPHPVGRKPVPVIVGGDPVPPRFALAAAPTPAHPRGTIVVVHHETVAVDGNLPRDTGDVSLVEVDLATASQVRSLPLGSRVELTGMGDGVRGPVVYLQSADELTVFWLDTALSVLARRSFPALGHEQVEPCAFGVVGDRAVLTDCGQGAITRTTRTWALDERGTMTKRSCPGASQMGSLEVQPWRGRVVVTGLGGGRGWYVCAFRADGSSGVTVGEYPFGEWPVVREGVLHFFADKGTDATPFRALGDDLRPSGPLIADPRRPEILAAEHLVGYASRLRATLVEGLIVLVAGHCCGEWGPNLYIFDPHADHE